MWVVKLSDMITFLLSMLIRDNVKLFIKLQMGRDMKSIKIKWKNQLALAFALLLSGSATQAIAQIENVTTQASQAAQAARAVKSTQESQAAQEAKDTQLATEVSQGDAAVADLVIPSLDTSSDPSENFNRAMFAFNEAFDKYFMKPVAQFYNKIMPKPLNQGVHNFFVNIDQIPTIANDLLQFNFYQFSNDMWRFGVNSTFGIGGLFDVASRINLGYYKNDFGLTLASYGYMDSSYLVLPFIGPRTWRDGFSFFVDYYPLSIYPYIRSDRLRYGLYAYSVLDYRANALQFENVLEEAAIDKYVFVRDAYMQRRAYEIKRNQHLGVFERDDIPQLNQD